VDGESSSKDDDITNRTAGGTEVKKNKCPRCDGDHLLARCGEFKKDTVKDQVKLVRKKGLCSYLHPQSVKSDDTRQHSWWSKWLCEN
jgi:hypothetical protein